MNPSAISQLLTHSMAPVDPVVSFATGSRKQRHDENYLRQQREMQARARRARTDATDPMHRDSTGQKVDSAAGCSGRRFNYEGTWHPGGQRQSYNAPPVLGSREGGGGSNFYLGESTYIRPIPRGFSDASRIVTGQDPLDELRRKERVRSELLEYERVQQTAKERRRQEEKLAKQQEAAEADAAAVHLPYARSQGGSSGATTGTASRASTAGADANGGINAAGRRRHGLLFAEQQPPACPKEMEERQMRLRQLAEDAERRREEKKRIREQDREEDKMYLETQFFKHTEGAPARSLRDRIRPVVSPGTAGQYQADLDQQVAERETQRQRERESRRAQTSRDFVSTDPCRHPDLRAVDARHRRCSITASPKERLHEVPQEELRMYGNELLSQMADKRAKEAEERERRMAPAQCFADPNRLPRRPPPTHPSARLEPPCSEGEAPFATDLRAAADSFLRRILPDLRKLELYPNDTFKQRATTKAPATSRGKTIDAIRMEAVAQSQLARRPKPVGLLGKLPLADQQYWKWNDGKALSVSPPQPPPPPPPSSYPQQNDLTSSHLRQYDIRR